MPPQYRYNVKYCSPPLMGDGQGQTTITETVRCDKVKINHYFNPQTNKPKTVDFIECKGDNDSIENEILKLSIKFERFISASKEYKNE